MSLPYVPGFTDDNYATPAGPMIYLNKARAEAIFTVDKVLSLPPSLLSGSISTLLVFKIFCRTLRYYSISFSFKASDPYSPSDKLFEILSKL